MPPSPGRAYSTLTRGTAVSWKSSAGCGGLPVTALVVGRGNALQRCQARWPVSVSPSSGRHAASATTISGSYCAVPAMWISGSVTGKVDPRSLVTVMS